MASDFFLEIVSAKAGTIKGEAVSTALPDQIQVDDFKIGVKAPTDYSEGGQKAASAPQLEEVEFTVPVSIATAALFQTICTNDAIKTATLSCRKAGHNGKKNTYLQWRFHNARLVSYNMSVTNAEPVDKITMSYSKVEISYSRQKQDGSMESARTAMYDADKNSMTKPTLAGK